MWGAQVVVPETLRQQLSKELHHDHPGMLRMKTLARACGDSVLSVCVLFGREECPSFGSIKPMDMRDLHTPGSVLIWTLRVLSSMNILLMSHSVGPESNQDVGQQWIEIGCG